MTFDLASLFPDFEALTPDGRWNALQTWLKENPEYGDRIEAWSTQSVDQVYVSIRDLVAEKYGISGKLISLLLIGKERQIKSTIETLQACYRERAGEQEIKHVRKRNSKKRLTYRSDKGHIKR